MDKETPARLLQWTLGLAIILAGLEYWRAESSREHYFAEKSVRESPADADSWLNLGWQYLVEANKEESQANDDEQARSNPKATYSEALDCFQRAISLGADDFETYFGGAGAADGAGKSKLAVEYAKRALAMAGEDDHSEGEAQEIQMLTEIEKRNAAEPTEEDVHRLKVRGQRFDRVPRVVKWVFELFDMVPES